MTEPNSQTRPGEMPTSAVIMSGGASPGGIPPGNIGAPEDYGAPLSAIANMGDLAPSLPVTANVVSGISAWQNNKRIIALWSINQNRNSWIGVDGIGWKRLANNSDSAIVALAMLGAHAREKGSVVNYREESDGMVREIYVW